MSPPPSTTGLCQDCLSGCPCFQATASRASYSNKRPSRQQRGELENPGQREAQARERANGVPCPVARCGSRASAGRVQKPPPARACRQLKAGNIAAAMAAAHRHMLSWAGFFAAWAV